jgi:enoyl-CoA hydratase/carnithine racemase
MFERLAAAVEEVRRGPDLALVLTGEGPVFCGGFDLKRCLEKPETLDVLLRGLAGLIEALRALPKPVVVAAHGAAIAGGCAILAAADVVVTDEQGKIGYPVTPLGISPAVSASSLRLAIGDGRARERLLDPGLISGREAGRIGLAHEVVTTPAEVRERAMEIARGLAEKPAGSWAATKVWVGEVEKGMGMEGAARRALEASVAIVGGNEEREKLGRLLSRP